MQSVGEVMAIGRTFCESLQKALRSLEQGRAGLNADPAEAALDELSADELLERIAVATPERIFELEAALRRGVGGRRGGRPDRHRPLVRPPAGPHRGRAPSASRPRRRSGRPTSGGPSGSGSPTRSWPTCAARPRRTCGRPGWRTACGRRSRRSTPARPSSRPSRRTTTPPTRRRTRSAPPSAPASIILGSGPNRIGQGIEFDYCCVHASMSLRDAGLRDRDGQLQPRDGLDRLRHVGPPLLRAVDRRGRGQRARRRVGGGREGGGGHRLPRRADAPEAGRLPPARAGARDEPGLHRPGRGPRALERVVPRARRSRSRPAGRRPAHGGGARRRRAGSATRSSCARATSWAAGPWRSSTTTTGCAASCSR